ncbi:MAG TPA: hypothetical protein VLD85_06970 [Anaeromyxobacteraceae bacterium]|nr:hypothetical protein [Anaeromyxobacteraceae bacterium]
MRQGLAMGIRTWGTLLPVGLAALAQACASDVTTGPDLVGVPVITYRAPGAAFSSFGSFAIVSRPARIDASGAPATVDAPGLVAAVAAHLEARGFQQAVVVDPAAPPAAPVAADLSVSIVALDPPQPQDPTSWIGDPAHPAPSLFGYAGSWGYPWTWAPLAVLPGTLLVEVADLAGAGTGGPVVVWVLLAPGAATGGGSYDAAGVLEAVDRGFTQSSYLSAGTP